MFRINLGDGSAVHVTRDGREYDREFRCYRQRFRWSVRDAAGASIAFGTNLRSPDWVDMTERRMAATFASFLSAFAEADEPGDENHDLFPAELRQWAEANSDELYLAFAECDF